MQKIVKIPNHLSCPAALLVTMEPHYEYRTIVAEESAVLNPNTTEWSYGDRDTGYIGIPLPAGFQLVEIGFNADIHAANGSVEVSVRDWQVSSPTAPILGSISLADPSDGFGQVNRSAKIVDLVGTVLTAPALVGFRTESKSGTVSSARVYATFRRKIGNVVTNIENR